MKYEISTHLAPQPSGAYSQGVQVGNLVFVAGQAPINPKTGKIEGTNVTEQTKQVGIVLLRQPHSHQGL